MGDRKTPAGRKEFFIFHFFFFALSFKGFT